MLEVCRARSRNRSRVRTESWCSPSASCTASIAGAKAVASFPKIPLTDSPA